MIYYKELKKELERLHGKRAGLALLASSARRCCFQAVLSKQLTSYIRCRGILMNMTGWSLQSMRF